MNFKCLTKPIHNVAQDAEDAPESTNSPKQGVGSQKEGKIAVSSPNELALKGRWTIAIDNYKCPKRLESLCSTRVVVWSTSENKLAEAGPLKALSECGFTKRNSSGSYGICDYNNCPIKLVEVRE